MNNFYIGIDGGATKSIIRIEDEMGNLLGRTISGPANIRISVEQSWQAILSGIEKILSSVGISLHHPNIFLHAGMGLSGCEVKSAYQTFINTAHPFKNLCVISDAHTACLGAHAGEDGAVIIIGTGVVGYNIQSSKIIKVGGWGFPHDDMGSGAWLGLHATKIALQTWDKRLAPNAIADEIYKKFDNDFERLVAWANQANSTAFAELAPIVIQQLQQGDAIAEKLIQQAAQAISAVGAALAISDSQVTLIGGLAEFIAPYLDKKLQSRLTPCKYLPDEGAIFFIKDYLKKHCHG